MLCAYYVSNGLFCVWFRLFRLVFKLSFKRVLVKPLDRDHFNKRFS